MYKGFEVKLESKRPILLKGKIVKYPDIFTNYREYNAMAESARNNLEKQKAQVKRRLDDYVRKDGVIDGGRISEDWFPEIDADVFLSHSHADERLVLAFAGWLEAKFGIRAFIDSCVWGYADDLLKELDERYCYQPSSRTYNYSKRNRTTAFVHNLLASALTKMMDKCECLMFVNTPNSISESPEQNETSSPWIYYELAQSQVLRSHLKRVHMFTKGGVMDSLNESFRVALPARTSHLTKLNNAALGQWLDDWQRGIADIPLDLLYSYK